MRVPAVSVILPTFNREAYLRASVASVFGQTFGDWELVVADDGSDEPVRAYLRDLQSDARVRVVWRSHTGNPAQVRNAALRVASGTYVAFLDSDDLWEPTKLQRQVELLRLRTSCRWCYCAFLRVDEQGMVLAAEANRPWTPAEGAIFEQILTATASLRTPCVLASRELVEQLGGFDESLQDCEDLDLWMRLALASDAALVDEPLVHVRIAGGSYTSRQRHARLDLIRVIVKLQSLADRRWDRVLHRELVRQTALMARDYARDGQRRLAMDTLVRCVALAWRDPRYWHHVLRSLIHVIQPGR